MSAASPPTESPDGSTPERSRIPPVARWGAACAPCATAKAKCLRSNNTPGSKCDRCDRLFKNCTDQVHKPRKKRQSRPSRTTQLEERLNRLVTSLRVSGNASAISNLEADGRMPQRRAPLVPNYSATLPPGHPDLLTQTRSVPWEVEDRIKRGPVTIPETYNCFVPPTCICRSEPGHAPEPPDTDENLLATYRDELAPHFPFVIVSASVSAATLAATRPFLMAAIRMVASFRSPRSMRGQAYALMSHIADHMLLRCERSLDLLLGLVVILGWFHHHCIAHAQLNQLISLAASLVGELGLKRGPSVTERTKLMVMRPSEMRQRTNEERRLLLAVWYLSSAISLDMQQIDPMRFSGYMQQCLRELEEARELESDMHVIYIVRIQRLAERISQIRGDGDEEAGVIKAPISAYASSFQAELNKLQAQMPRSLRDNHFLKVRMATARLRLYEPPTIDADLLASLSKSLTSLSSSHASALDVFYQANAALKEWFAVWLATPMPLFHTMPLTLASHMIFAVVMMSRWAWLAASSSGTVPHSGPGSRGGRSVPTDPSTDDPNVALAAMEAAINPNTPATGSTSTPSSTNNNSSSSKSSWDSPAAADNDLPRVLAELKAQLSRQPDLMIDVADVLNRVAEQLEEVDAAMAEVSADEGPWRGNIWTLGATKVRIAQLRQKRWSDMVSAAGEERDDRGEEDEGPEEQGPMVDVEMQESMAANFPVMGPWDYDGTWGPNLYDIVDPTMFLDGIGGGTTGDWAAAGLMGMPPVEHMPGTHPPGGRYMYEAQK
ncbi:C6 transcription factor [Colletotrichum sojae]|uniref:C6 transcription factor n=1 Tax=Colletotrichum sojae TaxID=2175907 RepID=A0A8H6JKY2_9PEZI|nr:C6 transcription factor [Colletotrichum sojae]